MNLQKMMQQAQAMQQKVGAVKEQIDAMEVEGRAGGGAVVVNLNGKMDRFSVRIDDSLMKPEEKDMLEDLIGAAFQDARAKIEEASSTQMNALTKSLNLPPGFKLPM